MPSKLASVLERERKARNLSYRGLARVLGVSLSQAHDWANDNGEPRIANIKLISKKLGIDIAELLG